MLCFTPENYNNFASMILERELEKEAVATSIKHLKYYILALFFSLVEYKKALSGLQIFNVISF